MEKPEFDKLVQEGSLEYNKTKVKCIGLRFKRIDCFKEAIKTHENEWKNCSCKWASET